jgi:pentapeptide MXKDX repeat protein
MRKLWQLLAVVVVGVSLGVAVVGCGSSPSTNKDKMGSDKMGSDKMMGGDKMGGDKKMEGDKGGK